MLFNLAKDLARLQISPKHQLSTDAKGCFSQKYNDGRQAKCDYCRNQHESDTDLPFFKHRPDKAFDSYYCGCCGWE